MEKGLYEPSLLLQHNSHLRFLRQQVLQQQKVLAALQSQLAPPLREHCLYARVDGQRLVVHVDHANWASQLRFLARNVLAGLKPLAPGLRKLEVRILPETPASFR